MRGWRSMGARLRNLPEWTPPTGYRLVARQARTAVSTAALVDALHAAGIRLSHDSGDLVADVLPGANLDRYREQITAHKPALLAELRLREEIVAAASAARDAFDRQRYDALWAEWHELHTTEATS